MCYIGIEEIMMGIGVLVGLVLLALLVTYGCMYCCASKGKNVNGMNPWKEFWHDLRKDAGGYIYYILILLVVLVLMIVVAWKLELGKCELWTIIEKFFKDHSVIASITGTMIGLLITFWALRPKLILKRVYMYKHIKGGHDSISFCIANIGIFPVHDVEVSAFWYREPKEDSEDENDHYFQNELKTIEMEIFRPGITSINGIFKKGNTYSCHVAQSFETVEKKKDSNDDEMKRKGVELKNGELYEDKLLCRVRATHSLSGLSKVYEWRFTRDDIIGIKKSQRAI